MKYEILQWDSSFFGFTVAKIHTDRVSGNEINEIIEDMKIKNVRLAYWASDPGDLEPQSCARISNAILTDRKVTYFTALPDVCEYSFCNTETVVEEYHDLVSTPELEELAVQAGTYSRFKVDSQIPENKFLELYKIWIRRSVNREIAKKVFVVRSEGKIAGVVTVGEKDDRADIGLIAVDPSLRGKNAGMALVQVAQEWGVKEGYSVAQVVTQADNVVACRFYEKCGYRIERIQNIYHLWIVR